MLMSWAILSRVPAVGVGFLLNSNSRVTSWSWVARWRLLFFCCWVKVLFRGGLRAEGGAVVAVELEGEGVEVAEEGEEGLTRAEERDGSGVTDMVAEAEFEAAQLTTENQEKENGVRKAKINDEPATDRQGIKIRNKARSVKRGQTNE